jgi:hypothetical protein
MKHPDWSIRDILHYMDNVFNICSRQLKYYAPYDRYMPWKQVSWLELWDHLGIPHEPEKQLYGESLEITGFLVNTRDLTISLPPDSILKILDTIEKFVDTSLSRRRTLREFQRLLGHLNWALNVFPLLRPALQLSYQKISGKQIPNAPLYLNRSIIANLTWFGQMVRESEPIHMLAANVWEAHEADLTLWCDAASTGGLGFWSPSHQKGFASELPPNPPTSTIYYFKALCVVSALLWASKLCTVPKQLLIFSDLMNMVNTFNSLKADNDYNSLLHFAVEILLWSKISLCVYHIPDDENVVADTLSHFLWDVAQAHLPGLSIHLFQPPQDVMGVSKL